MAEMLPAKQKVDTVREMLISYKEQIRMALPKHLTADRMSRLVMTEVARNPKLLECTPRSLIGAVIQTSQLGLEIGILGRAYFVPFRNNKAGTTEVQFIPGYKGLIDLARRSGQISTVQAHEVYAKDEFKYQYGLDPILIHKPDPSPDRGELTFFYAIARLKDGGTQFEVRSKAQIDQHRDRYSRAAKDGPWVTNYVEMALKTVLRMLCKLLPTSTELATAIVLDERAEAQIPQELGELVGNIPEDPGSQKQGDGQEGKERDVTPRSSLDTLREKIEDPKPAARQEGQPLTTEPPSHPEVERAAGTSAAGSPYQPEQSPSGGQTTQPPPEQKSAGSTRSLLESIELSAKEHGVPITAVDAFAKMRYSHGLVKCDRLELEGIHKRLSTWEKGQPFSSPV